MSSKKTASSKKSPEKKYDHAGQPTKYDPKFCEMLIDFCRDGSAFEEFASECEVCIATLYNWAKEHKEFLEAKKKAEAHSLRWWLSQGRTNLKAKVFRDVPWIFNVKCRFAKYGFNPDNSLNSFFDGDEDSGVEFVHA